MNQINFKEYDWKGKKISFSTGGMAFFADSALRVDFGETSILITVVSSSEPREDINFLPLTVEYEEKFYASGKISGSRFVKREGRPSEEAILNARLVDRSIRPLFPSYFRNDIQIVITVLSYSPDYPPEIAAILGSSLALMLSKIPFEGPIGAIRVGLKKNELILNPSDDMENELELNLIVVATEDKILMIEGYSYEIPEERVLEVIKWAHKELKFSLGIQKDFLEGIKIEKNEYLISESDIHVKMDDLLGKELRKILQLRDEQDKELQLGKMEEKALEKFSGVYKHTEIKEALDKLVKKETRALIKNGQRPDGRREDEIRPLNIKTSVLPRTHGSSLFERGQTQVLSITTLDSPSKEQLIDTMEEEGNKRFILHYNFPPYSAGEIRPLTAPSRREIGHGALAERALRCVIPSKKEFPYTIRVVSEVLSSNGSTSMASVCASTLSLMDAGVPIKNMVAGIAMGLVAEEKDGKILEKKILTDIQGVEDFAGDMDFKIAGTEQGITALQLDLKIKGIDIETIREVFERAKKARLSILEEMKKVLPKPREISPLAPAIETISVNPQRIGDVIGPGGKVIREIISQTGTDIDVEPEGIIYVSSREGNREKVKEAVQLIKNLTREFRIGEIFSGRVTKVADFGVFVEIFPGQQGLVHISELSDKRIRNIHDIIKVGDVIPVKLIRIDEQGRLSFSIKSLPPSFKKKIRF